MSGGLEIGAVEFVKAGLAQAQFGGDGAGREALGAMSGQEMTNEGRGKTMNQLMFFMAASVTGRWIFRFPSDAGRG